MLLKNNNLAKKLEGSALLLDTAVYIKASKNLEFFDFVKDLSENSNISLLTLPAVSMEWLAQAKSLDEYNKLANWFNGLGASVYQQSVDLPEYDPEFNILLQSLVPKASHTDKLLCMMLNKFKHTKIYLVTSNHHDMPPFFSFEHVVTLDLKRAFSNIVFYKFDDKDYEKKLSKLRN